MESTEGYQNKAMVITEASSVHRATEVVCQFYQRLYTQSVYLRCYQESVCYTSVALCSIGTSMPLPLPPPLSVPLCTLLYESFSLSIHISEEPYFCLKLIMTQQIYYIIQVYLERVKQKKILNNVSSTNSEQCKLCVNGPLYIDARLLWKQAIGSNCS